MIINVTIFSCNCTVGIEKLSPMKLWKFEENNWDFSLANPTDENLTHDGPQRETQTTGPLNPDDKKLGSGTRRKDTGIVL